MICALRAIDGRVLNIGTEWSNGVCEITDHHLKFVPTMGIVGERRIPVLNLTPIAEEPHFGTTPAWADSAHFVLSTHDGDLAWAFPKYIANDIVARLLPDLKPAQKA
ncbi:hypothetical protein FFT87_04165 [Salinibacterium sp. M195]|nr:hypothetical protein FFT87_04165 [Salinibacterium sp. M195]